MKKSLMVLAVICFFIGLVSASIAVNNYNVQNNYGPFEKLKGTINLSISEEPLSAKLISSFGEEMSFEDFLISNNADYNCSTLDCAKDYNVFSSGKDRTLSVTAGKTRYFGFVLEGTNVEILQNGFYFNVESDFGEGTEPPLKMEFFERYEWNFNEFSETLSLGKEWGCYGFSLGEAKEPLISPSYCQSFPIKSTGKIFTGAKVSGTDSKDLKMKLYSGSEFDYEGSCEYNPSEKDGCSIIAGKSKTFSGDYHVCVSADNSNYKLYSETSGKTCGFIYSERYDPGNSTKDYGIYVRTANYANSSGFSSRDFEMGSLDDKFDDYIDEKYGRDCSDKCIVPIAISGVPQNIRMSNITLKYTRKGGAVSDDSIYSLGELPVLLDFEGVLDLKYSRFLINHSGLFSLSLGVKTLFEKSVEKLNVPSVLSLTPLNPPAGVPVEFILTTGSVGNSSLKYKWEFGNGRTETTDVPHIINNYEIIRNYTLHVTVTSSLGSSKSSFNISVADPSEAMNKTLVSKKNSLDKISASINAFPSWYRVFAEKALNLSFYSSELDRMTKAQNVSLNGSKLINLVGEVYALRIPSDFNLKKELRIGLLNNPSDINLVPVSEVGGKVDFNKLDKYKDLVIDWQEGNINSDISSDEFFVSLDGNVESFLKTYRIDLRSSYGERSYLVIDAKKSDVVFKGVVSAESSGDYTVIPLGPQEIKTFEFYLKEPAELGFFVSPRLSDVVLPGDIDTSCNFNGLCESGESSKTCRSDCKPVFSAVFYVILAVIVMLLIYTLLQIWYKIRYESYLFSDRNQLYNLLMFVTNARVHGADDKKIVKNLKKQGWSGERIDYVLKKSRGARVGLPEIIPIEKIASYFRAVKAKKSATFSQQQFKRKVNKFGFQKRR